VHFTVVGDEKYGEGLCDILAGLKVIVSVIFSSATSERGGRAGACGWAHHASSSMAERTDRDSGWRMALALSAGTLLYVCTVDNPASSSSVLMEAALR